MLDSMFGLEFSLPMKFFIAFAIVLILIGTAAYLLRRFGSGALAVAGQRNRQPRLAVVDATAIDNRRKLVIVRRDNVEHLLLIGGPTDVLVEPNIVRGSAVQTAREIAPMRPVPAEPLNLPEASGWPLTPEPQPVARAEPVIRPVPVAPVHAEIPPPQVAPAMPERPAPPRVSAPAAPPAPAPAPVAPPAPRPQPAEVAAAKPAPDARPAAPVRPAAHAPAAVPPSVAPAMPAAPAPHVEIASAAVLRAREEATASTVPEAAPPLRPNEEQNLAEMAHRLEAALSRPVPAPPQRPAMPPVPPASPSQRPQAVPPPPAAAQRAPASSYENLQREMASLLGRQSGGS